MVFNHFTAKSNLKVSIIRHFGKFQTNDKLENIIQQYARKKQSTVSMKALMETGTIFVFNRLVCSHSW